MIWKTMETNVPGLNLAGVMFGARDTHLWFIENSGCTLN